MDNVGAQQAKRRKRTGAWRHHDTGHGEFFGDWRSMHCTCSAKRQQREFLWVDTALGAEYVNLIRHPQVDDAPDTGCGFQRRHAEWLAQLVFQRIQRCIDIKRLRAAQK